MKVKYKTTTGFNNINPEQWADLVSRHPYGNVFQSPEMFELFRLTDKFEPVVVAVVNENESLRGVLLGVVIREKNGIKGFFSARTVVYGGPLVHPGEERVKEVLGSLLQGLVKEVGRKSIFIQFRNFYDLKDHLDVFEKYGFSYKERLNFIVDTSSEEVVRSNISKSKLRQVRKALEAGARIHRAENEQQLRDFYDILYHLYKYKVQKPLPGWSFFRHFYELSEGGSPGAILLISYKEKIVGGILCPVTDKRVIYEWYVCGLDQDYKEIYPSVLATWAAIDHALRHGIKSFDFMGVGLPDREYGVRNFKARFGGEMTNYGRFSRINNKFYYHIAEVGYNLLTLIKKI